QAVRGNGGTVRLVFLPNESHGYVGRESVEHTLAEMIGWFDKYVKNAVGTGGRVGDAGPVAWWTGGFESGVTAGRFRVWLVVRRQEQESPLIAYAANRHSRRYLIMLDL
ncbi:MAG: hypothetical protein HY820_06155, partial [Acidobacteria bacterium]|nr:hypothetical protein [Acidobacteriota bacterium]